MHNTISSSQKSACGVCEKLLNEKLCENDKTDSYAASI